MKSVNSSKDSSMKSVCLGLEYSEIWDITLKSLTKYIITPISGTDILQISYKDKTIYLSGYSLNMNSLISVKISEDKKLTYNILSQFDIPTTPYELIINCNKKLYD